LAAEFCVTEFIIRHRQVGFHDEAFLAFEQLGFDDRSHDDGFRMSSKA
jgi:hypothetical protein